jgi:hypothetical protein
MSEAQESVADQIIEELARLGHRSLEAASAFSDAVAASRRED